ncbi:ZPR1 zinc finger domain-containing protein [Candidatus Woesearchaeota archaeon]|nr:ZPR1 zinc finger domain-containing protein [Candidatus Woesearchaeota archaeon]
MDSDISVSPDDKGIDKLDKQPCPFCHTKNLTLMEKEVDIPYFGKTFIFGMQCTNCDYHKSDIEAAESKGPVKYSLDIDSEDDMNIRIIRSSEGTIKIPHITTISPGPNAEGFITNVEGIFSRVKSIIEATRENEEDKSARKKAKNLLKKIQKIMWGQEKSKLILEDPSGNSAIISDKAQKK